jgi:hypothetical protein
MKCNRRYNDRKHIGADKEEADRMIRELQQIEKEVARRYEAARRQFTVRMKQGRANETGT